MLETKNGYKMDTWENLAHYSFLDKEAYIKILLLESKKLSAEENILLFIATQNYISNANGFKRYNTIN